SSGWPNLAIYIGVCILFGIIFFYLSPRIIKKGRILTQLIENELHKYSVYDITISSVGLILGLLIANLISQPFSNIPYVGSLIPFAFYIILGYLGLTIPHKKKDDIFSALGNIRKTPKEKDKVHEVFSPKILDTSVIIDGRISDICKTGFIEGPLVIPEFVLE